jgi:cytochrome c-type biogenesis protein CcmE
MAEVISAEMGTEEIKTPSAGRTRFLIGGLLIVAAIIYLIASSTQTSAQYFLTVDELFAMGEEAIGRDVRVVGAVDGDTIDYEPSTLTLRFTIVNVPGDLDEIERSGGLAEVLHQALLNPEAARLSVIVNGPKPDLLRHEAQAIITGQLGDDGLFIGQELLLKCPTRYESEVPLQVEEG